MVDTFSQKLPSLKRMVVLASLIFSCMIFLAPHKAGAVNAQTPTVLISANQTGGFGNNHSWADSMSDDGRYVVFSSRATDLVSSDTNGFGDAFVRDTTTNVTTLISVTSAGVQGNGNSGAPSISADGRYVTFTSQATNLVAGDANGTGDVFVKDMTTGVITRISTTASGGEANGSSSDSVISSDGSLVAFYSHATNLVADDTNNAPDIFVKNLSSGEVTRVSTDSAGGQSNGGSYANGPSLSFSADNRYVTFESAATNLVAGDTNNRNDIFVKDLQTGTTILASSNSAGEPSNSNNGGRGVSVSADGRYVAFSSCGTNLVPGFGVNCGVYRKDIQTGEIVLVATNAAGEEANDYAVNNQDGSGGGRIMSADGRYVIFHSTATNLEPSDTTNDWDIFVKDLVTGEVAVVTTSSDWESAQSISADGRFVSFYSADTNLVAGDTNARDDVFMRANPLATFVHDNDFTSVITVAGRMTASVLSSYTRNGLPINPSDYILSIVDDGGLTGLTINADGTLLLPVNAASGEYTVSYQLCEVAAPTSCQVASTIVAVQAAAPQPPANQPGTSATGTSGTLAETGHNISSSLWLAGLLVALGLAVTVTLAKRQSDRKFILK